MVWFGKFSISPDVYSSISGALLHISVSVIYGLAHERYTTNDNIFTFRRHMLGLVSSSSRPQEVVVWNTCGAA
jgi:hypothetical protein